MPATLEGFYTWLQDTPVSVTLETVPWMIPAIQTVHILCVSSVISSALLLHLRVIGITRGEQPVAAVARRFLPFIWWPLPILLITGSLLIAAEPARSLDNPSFWLKMSLLVTAIGATVLYQRKLAGDPNYWDHGSARRVIVKLIAAGSILLWVGIVFAGRWIAYTQP